MPFISSLPTGAMLSIFLLFYLPRVALSNPFPSFNKLQLPAIGPEALAFDQKGGLYTGVSDGRILKYQGYSDSFVDFATTSPHTTKALCNGTNDPNLGAICGRPLGLGFNYLTGELYIADPNFGLFMVGANGGLATQIANGVENMPFAFLNALDIDPQTGTVYFTDSGAIFRLNNITQIILSGDTTSRLLKYDPKTREVTVLLRGLSGATGVAVSKDCAFVLVTELIASRVRRFWIKGPKANSAEVLLNLSGYPDNIKRTILGDFWVAVSIQKLQPMPTTIPTGQRINGLRMVLETVALDAEYGATSVSEVQEYAGALYIGSLSANFVGVYRK
ncbi:protein STRICTOSIDINE SYNTHASE-LIKE 12-like [Cornus florida]|uniref:protein STRICTOSIDINE SYNTHASE-LIKE 12-like n=1 Tax=Cornus florida TaxID=4283 RepID=UPI00289BFB56|nr:protein STRICTOSIDINE SYNTHASE-LIKE 12-like [Cornus florida]